MAILVKKKTEKNVRKNTKKQANKYASKQTNKQSRTHTHTHTHKTAKCYNTYNIHHTKGTPNCGCFGKKYESDCITGHYTNGPWCTNYWYPDNKTGIYDGIMNLSYPLIGNLSIDCVFLVNQFQEWLLNPDNGIMEFDNTKQKYIQKRPFLAMVWLHSVHIEVLATKEWREACQNGTNCPKQSNDQPYTSSQLDYFGDLRYQIFYDCLIFMYP